MRAVLKSARRPLLVAVLMRFAVLATLTLIGVSLSTETRMRDLTLLDNAIK